ncbi:bifunctional nuclease domain-containing protein [Bacteroidota bacterium]
MDKVQVEIIGLSSSPSTGGAFALLLKESFGMRRLPIIIGSFEAQSIALEIEGIKPPRPLTHDLLKNFADNLGGTVKEVVIDALKENTFYAKIIVEVSTMINEIDSRPSDAIALAIRTGAPLYVREDVMKEASFVPSSEEETPEEDILEDSSKEKFMKTEETSKETKMAVLQDKLREAIEKEDYERAAALRDKINQLKGLSN